MHNVGEEIAGEYLRHILKCAFVQYNVPVPGSQGEIDVIGGNVRDRRVHVCEVAVHVDGLHYVKGGQPDNLRLIRKLEDGIAFARSEFPDYELHLMLWSPIVREAGPTAKHCSMRDVFRIKEIIQERHGLELQLVVNESYQNHLDNLREYAGGKSSNFSSSVMRVLQIEQKLGKHLAVRRHRKLEATSSSVAVHEIGPE